MRVLVSLLVVFLIVLTGCGSENASNPPAAPNQPPANTVNTVPCAPNSLEITLIFALNPQQNYMTPAINSFNGAYAEGRNPLTGDPLTEGETPICVLGELGSSSRTSQALANNIIAPESGSTVQPTMYSPSVSTWIELANYRAGRDLFDMGDVQPIALTPVVMAIWESRLDAIKTTTGRDDVGWAELIDVLNSPEGWRDYGIEDGRRAVYYGHTDPRRSSTAVSALIMEFYAAAAQAGYTDRRLTTEAVNDEAVQEGVRQIEQLIRHYSTRTDDYLDYIAQGTDYLDLVALEEIDIMYLNGAFTADGFAPPFTPPEPLVALYPREGVLWHERPIGIVDADWVTPEQRQAARTFVDYLLTPEIQQDVMRRGFRPVNTDIELAYPFVEENGVTMEGPATVLDMPAAETIVTIQQSWSVVKKRADVMLLMDVSGSMNDNNKIAQARAAAAAFVEAMEITNQVGLAVFSDEARIVLPMELLETNGDQLVRQINAIQADGGTELYAAIEQMVEHLNDREANNRIRALVVLSDGQDTGDDGVTLNDAIQAIQASYDDENPVIVIPLAYGDDADIGALSDIARASRTQLQFGNPDNIDDVLSIIQSFF